MEQRTYRSKLDKDLQFDGRPTLIQRGTWFPVLDKGFVRILDWMGNDAEIVNDARVSFMKEKPVADYNIKDARLVEFLGEHDHSSPFRHQIVKMEIYAPLMVARQWWKYVVGAGFNDTGWNEASRRYVTMEPEFYFPQWRTAPENKKQGSEDFLEDGWLLRELDTEMRRAINDGIENYEYAIKNGVAPEQARCFLPSYAMYTAWRWTASLQAVCHFISQRSDEHAQWEIREYAKPLGDVMLRLFPDSVPALLNNHPIALRRQIADLKSQLKKG